MSAVPRLGFVAINRLLRGFRGRQLPFLLGGSCTLDPVLPYLRGHAALSGVEARPELLPFGTLTQTLLAPPRPGPEVFFLTPWDFIGELDWRTGIPTSAPDPASCRERAQRIADRLAARPRAALIYLPAPIPPLFAQPGVDIELARRLLAMAVEVGAESLSESVFSLASYLATGCPIGGRDLEPVGAALAAAALRAEGPAMTEPAKLLVTDLDNVLWHGVVAEDGLDGIAFGPEGEGWPSFLYQGLLRRLKGEGVLLAAVSRNRPEEALAPLRSGLMTLGEDDFVAVIASYDAKSAQIRALAAQLNLGLDAAVFVDDNPIELAEVERELPEVARLAFPSDSALLPEFLQSLAGRFARGVITDEDRRRTELYRRRLATMAPVAAQGAELTDFLRGLEMRMVLRDRGVIDGIRAVQLINKTNQFNLNGRRIDDTAVAVLLARGGRLLTAELSDRTGSHGEVIALLVDADGQVSSFVMSCRVFQRRAEFAFLATLVAHGITLHSMDFAPTDKNEPFRRFLADPAFAAPAAGGLARIDWTAFAAAHGEDASLFKTEWA